MAALSVKNKHLLKLLVQSGRVRSGVTLVVVNTPFADTLRDWLAKPGAPQRDEILVFACDNESEQRWAAEGIEVISQLTDGSWGDLVSKRHEVLSELCRMGIDCFYSDADAFWLQDPRGYCMSLRADLAFSQGTVLPREVCRAWGFVLCTGFMFVRASQATADFFARTESQIRHSDQAALNMVLLAAGTAWQAPPEPKRQIRFRGLHWSREIPDEILSHYAQPVFGYSNQLGLSLCLLPHDRFPRIGPVGPSVMVEHLLDKKSEAWRQHVATCLGISADSAAEVVGPFDPGTSRARWNQ